MLFASRSNGCVSSQCVCVPVCVGFCFVLCVCVSLVCLCASLWVVCKRGCLATSASLSQVCWWCRPYSSLFSSFSFFFFFHLIHEIGCVHELKCRTARRERERDTHTYTLTRSCTHTHTHAHTHTYTDVRTHTSPSQFVLVFAAWCLVLLMREILGGKVFKLLQ